MAIGRSGNKVKERLGFLIWGGYGSGKSYLCTTALRLKDENGNPLKVLYIDPEQGSSDSFLNKMADEGIDTRNAWIVYTSDCEEISHLINKAKNNEDYYEYDDDGEEDFTRVVKDADGKPFRPDFIIVDGTTVMKQTKELARLAFSEKRAAVRADKAGVTGQAKDVAVEGADLEQKDYKQIAFDGRNLVFDLLASGKHFAITARAKKQMEYKLVDGKQVAVPTGLEEIDGFKDTAYNVKTVIHMVEEKSDFGSTYYGIIDSKDRTMVYNRGDKIENVSFLNWQSVIDKGIGLSETKFVNDARTAVDKEAAKIIDDANTKGKVDGIKDGAPTDSLSDLKEKVKNAIKSLNTNEEKKAVKAKAEAAGLSVAIDGYTSVEELTKLYKLIIG